MCGRNSRRLTPLTDVNMNNACVYCRNLVSLFLVGAGTTTSLYPVVRKYTIVKTFLSLPEQKRCLPENGTNTL